MMKRWYYVLRHCNYSRLSGDLSIFIVSFFIIRFLPQLIQTFSNLLSLFSFIVLLELLLRETIYTGKFL